MDLAATARNSRESSIILKENQYLQSSSENTIQKPKIGRVQKISIDTNQEKIKSGRESRKLDNKDFQQYQQQQQIENNLLYNEWRKLQEMEFNSSVLIERKVQFQENINNSLFSSLLESYRRKIQEEGVKINHTFPKPCQLYTDLGKHILDRYEDFFLDKEKNLKMDQKNVQNMLNNQEIDGIWEELIKGFSDAFDIRVCVYEGDDLNNPAKIISPLYSNDKKQGKKNNKLELYRFEILQGGSTLQGFGYIKEKVIQDKRIKQFVCNEEMVNRVQQMKQVKISCQNIGGKQEHNYYYFSPQDLQQKQNCYSLWDSYYQGMVDFCWENFQELEKYNFIDNRLKFYYLDKGGDRIYIGGQDKKQREFILSQVINNEQGDFRLYFEVVPDLKVQKEKQEQENCQQKGKKRNNQEKNRKKVIKKRGENTNEYYQKNVDREQNMEKKVLRF